MRANSLILGGSLGAEVTPFHSLLFAVNDGSNEISVLTVQPTSLTVHDDILYVLNAGVLPLGEGLTPSITGFRIEPSARSVHLVAISGSARRLTGSVTTVGATEAGATDPTGH
ncbi:MAG: hypothetical protein ACRDQX_08265 [Pseudonocardiaceae bacterium]